MRTTLVALALAVCLAAPGLWAQDSSETPSKGPAGDQAASSEEDFFGSAPVEAPQGAAEKKGVADVVEQEHVGLSGQLQAMSTYTMARSFVQGSGDLGDNTFSNLVGGDFLVDVRLQKGFKAFLDLNLSYVPGGVPVVHNFTQIPSGIPLVASENLDTALLIKEVFLDFNIANTVYFRAGKQVLKWGTGYFWNPSDLISIEHRSFTNPNALLQGVFGLRSDAVLAPWWHLYTFLNLNDLGANDIWGTALAARSEFLVGSTEFAVSSWLKSGKIPVFGGDLSTPLPLDWWARDGHSLALTAEGTVSWGDNQDKIGASAPYTAYAVRDQLVAKIDVGLSRTFDLLGVPDRMNVEVEFFFNSDGYARNMFELVPGFATSGYFQSGYYGQYYGAAFVTISDFGTTNTTLSLSGLANFSDLSATVLAGIAWSPVNNFTLSLQLGSYLGAADREYTVAFDTSTGQLTSGNQFFGILTATVAF